MDDGFTHIERLLATYLYELNKAHKGIRRLARKNKRLREENDELNNLFDLINKAQRRAIKMWQEETGRDMEWPDYTELCAWLLRKIDAKGETDENNR